MFIEFLLCENHRGKNSQNNYGFCSNITFRTVKGRLKLVETSNSNKQCESHRLDTNDDDDDDDYGEKMKGENKGASKLLSLVLFTLYSSG